MKRCAELSASAEITAVQEFWQPLAMNFYHFRMARRLPLLRADEAKHYVAISYISIKSRLTRSKLLISIESSVVVTTDIFVTETIFN